MFDNKNYKEWRLYYEQRNKPAIFAVYYLP